MPIESYHVLSEESLSKLIQETNKWIEKGWQPIGSMTISIREILKFDTISSGVECNYYQTIAKIKEGELKC